MSSDLSRAANGTSEISSQLDEVVKERDCNRDAVRKLVDEHLHDKQDHAYRLWALLMLELWHREFID